MLKARLPVSGIKCLAVAVISLNSFVEKNSSFSSVQATKVDRNAMIPTNNK
jgi:hypothetical protein